MPATLVITGGIGSGKSLVCRMLAEKGVPAYDSDSAAKRLYDTDAQLLESIVRLFGRGILDDGGRIDREKLSVLVFSDEASLKALEALVHPAVFRDFFRWKSAQSGQFVVYESALALQKGLPEGFADELILVDAPLDVRVDRACRRDGRTKTEVEARARLQTVDAGDPRITYILNNDGTEDDLAEKVGTLYQEMNIKYRSI